MPFCSVDAEGRPVACGLVFPRCEPHAPEEAAPVPLKSVGVAVRMVDFVAEVTIEQVYENVEDRPIEAVYVFPVEEEAAVVAFEADVDGRVIQTKVKPKQEARQEYDEAVAKEETAVLLEELQPDMFSMKLGQLKPKAKATIKLTYVSELPLEEPKAGEEAAAASPRIRLTVPTTVAPRYTPPEHLATEQGQQIASIRHSLESPAKLHVRVTGKMQAKVKSVESPSHKFRTQIQGDDEFTSVLEGETTEMNRDIVLLVQGDRGQDQMVVFLEEPMDDEAPKGGMASADATTCMVSFVPRFQVDAELDQKHEIIFLVDRSGSMEGQSILQAKEALRLFLHSLPAGCHFNIWGFGSTFQKLFVEGSAAYGNDTLKKAKEHVDSMQADLGGTEIYAPLKEILSKAPVTADHTRQVFVLTDGDVSNAPAIIALVAEHCRTTRLFTLGIGECASRHLVKGVARAGGGVATFAGMEEDLRPKVMGLLKNAMHPAMRDVTLTLLASEVEGTAAADVLKQVPSKLPLLYDGSRMLAYFTLKPGTPAPTGLRLKAQSGAGGEKGAVNLHVHRVSQVIRGKFVGQLAARKQIQELEMTIKLDQFGNEIVDDPSFKEVKAAVEELAVRHSLASKFTSFVGVDKGSGEGAVSGKPMEQRVVAQQVPLHYGGITMPQMACLAMPAAMPAMARNCYLSKSSRLQSLESAGLESMAYACDAMDQADFEEAAEDKSGVTDTVDSSQQVSALTLIIDQQEASGAFMWEEAVFRRFLGDRDQVTKARPAEVEESVWLTALAVMVLETEMAGEKAIWELVAVKARRFLAANYKKGSVESLMVEVEKYLKGVK